MTQNPKISLSGIFFQIYLDLSRQLVFTKNLGS